MRAAVAVAIIAGWLAVCGVGGPVFGRIGEVQKSDQAAFLPASAEATKALEWRARFSDTDSAPAIILLESDEQLPASSAAPLLADLGAAGLLGGEPAVLPAPDGKAIEIIAQLDPELKVAEATQEVRGLVASAAGDLPGTARGYVTGPAGFATDLVEAFGGVDALVLLVALGAVFVILLLVYRSFLLPVIVLATSMSALCAAILTVYWMARWQWITLDGQARGILSILVIGAATDYALLYVARYREELVAGWSRLEATRRALRGAVEPIVASASTVIAGLMCLLLSDLNSNRALGPIAACGIVFSVLAALTLLPAILGLLGRASFWPFMPGPGGDRCARGRGAEGRAVEDGGEPADDEARTRSHSLWWRIALKVERHPRPILVVTIAALGLGCLAATQLRADGVPQSDIVLRSTESAAGQRAIGKHFDAGSGSPAYAVVAEGKVDDALRAASGVDGVSSAFVQADGGGPVRPGAPASVVEGRVLLAVTLADPPDSPAAQATIRNLRAALTGLDSQALVGGQTATALDSQTTARADLVTIIPIIAAAILLILMVLLRAIVAPLVLMATTVLSYGAAMGVAALVFRHIFGFSGADPAVPLFGFVFLVALGVDYNIFLATRVREEALGHPPRQAVTRALAVTGGVITSAGVVLAATFAVLGVIPIMFMVQLGFIVAFGVLLDTLVVRTLLVPALAHELGRWMWWPSALSRPSEVTRLGVDVRPGAPNRPD